MAVRSKSSAICADLGSSITVVTILLPRGNHQLALVRTWSAPLYDDLQAPKDRSLSCDKLLQLIYRADDGVFDI